MTKEQSKKNPERYAPAFLRARHEAIIILVVWVVGMLWTISYCFITGYDVPSGQIRAVMGIPRWIFFGVLAPWIVITIFTIWFSLFYIADDDREKTHA